MATAIEVLVLVVLSLVALYISGVRLLDGHLVVLDEEHHIEHRSTLHGWGLVGYLVLLALLSVGAVMIEVALTR